ncbi:MAG: hypothetical protein ACRC2V_26925 [Xenococcaceae cyanobacterium]
MNIELAQKVLAHIKEHEEAFSMDYVIADFDIDYTVPNYPCGTVACIAGWTVLLSEKRLISSSEIENDFSQRSWHKVKREAMELLDISNKEATWLFVPVDDDGNELEDDDAIARFETFIEANR